MGNHPRKADGRPVLSAEFKPTTVQRIRTGDAKGGMVERDRIYFDVPIRVAGTGSRARVVNWSTFVTGSGMTRRAVLAALCLLAFTPNPARPEGFGAPFTSQFRIEWKQDKSRKGEPIIVGYLVNTGPVGADSIVLLCEILDAQTQVVDKAYLNLPDIIQGFDRVYFEIPLHTTGASYRMSVYRFSRRDFSGSGGGGM